MIVLACLALLVSLAQQLYIRVNQLGFAPADVKTAVVFGREPLPSEFRVVDAASGKVVFTGRVSPIAGGWGQFLHHVDADFSSLEMRGSGVIGVGDARL